MKQIKQISTVLLVSAVTFVFLLSTSGFTFYRHICVHHENKASILNMEDCCTTDLAEEVDGTNGCCSEFVQEYQQVCHTDPGEGNCCETSMSYFRLEQHFLQSEDHAQDWLIPVAIQVSTSDMHLAEESTGDTPVEAVGIRRPPPKRYLIYHCQRIEPALA